MFRFYLTGGAAGGAKPGGSSKAAFAMFQQKDVAAGGTGKVSRYFENPKSNLSTINL